MVMGEEGGGNQLLFSLHCGNDLSLIYIILEDHVIYNIENAVSLLRLSYISYSAHALQPSPLT